MKSGSGRPAQAQSTPQPDDSSPPLPVNRKKKKTDKSRGKWPTEEEKFEIQPEDDKNGPVRKLKRELMKLLTPLQDGMIQRGLYKISPVFLNHQRFNAKAQITWLSQNCHRHTDLPRSRDSENFPSEKPTPF